MTAGSGVTHTERTPIRGRRKGELKMHGYQIWIAFPKEKAEMEPQFEYYRKNEISTWKSGSLSLKLVAGNAFGESAPLQGFSPLFMVDIYAEESTTLDLRDQLKGEVAFVIVKGSITEKDKKVTAGQMLISKSNEQCEICLEKGTQLLIFGGEPLADEPLLLWNFVSHNKERLQKAKEDWKKGVFPKVLGDDTYIPFPEY